MAISKIPSRIFLLLNLLLLTLVLNSCGINRARGINQVFSTRTTTSEGVAELNTLTNLFCRSTMVNGLATFMEISALENKESKQLIIGTEQRSNKQFEDSGRMQYIESVVDFIQLSGSEVIELLRGLVQLEYEVEFGKTEGNFGTFALSDEVKITLKKQIGRDQFTLWLKGDPYRTMSSSRFKEILHDFLAT